MKYIILPALFAAAAMHGALPASAATLATTHAEAQARGLINDDGYVIFAYADGWDKFSKKRCEKLMAAAEIRKAAGNAVLMPWPVPEYTTDETRQAANERRGSLNIPGSHSYPALLLLDRKGRHYATIAGTPMARGKVSEVAELLADRMARGKKRFDLLARAEQTPGPEKAKLTLEAYQIDGLTGFGKGFNNHIAKMDPNDTTGAKRAANYNHYGLLDKLGKMPAKEAVAEVEKLLEDPAYSNRQKQQMCVALIGVLRRNTGAEGAADIRRFTQRMEAYAPDSPEGRAADRILREWVKELSYDEGWSPSSLPPDTKPVELKGKLPIEGPGTYTVHFAYTGGRQALTIRSVELYDGKTKVAEDVHNGSTGHANRNNTYTLNVSKPVREPHLFISFDMKNRDSRGTITIEKQ